MQHILPLHWWLISAGVIIISMLFTILFTPICKWISIKIDLVDRPKNEAHKLHAKITPLLGGLAMSLGWITALLIAFLIAHLTPSIFTSEIIHLAANKLLSVGVHLPMLYIIIGAFITMFLGLYDDKYAMSAGKKFLGQMVIAALTIYFADVRINIPILPYYASFALTLFWFALIFNAINFFDNMDGLAAGTCCISLTMFTAVALITGQYFIATFSALAAGVALGFWFFNHSPASIFMGDSGSHFLAYLLAVISVKITYITPDARTYFSLLIPVIVLLMPLFDVLAVITIRIVKKKPIHKGDHNHISHRFVAMGMSRMQAVLAVHLLSIIAGITVIPLLWANKLITTITLLQTLCILLLISLLQYHARKES